MQYPPRLSHLVTRRVLIARLMPTYAEAHRLDEDEAAERLETALDQRLVERLLEAIWSALQGSKKRLDDAGLVEKVARSLQDRPLRPGRKATVGPEWSAFLILLDVTAGTASEAARKLLESEEGRKRVAVGLAEVGRFLAAELTR